jgi:hypothetical protein
MIVALCAASPPIAARAETLTSTQTLVFRARVVPLLVDYELPGHPNTRGRGHAGIVGRFTLEWTHDQFVAIEAGMLGRVPFAHDFSEETGALPVLALTLHPFGAWTTMRFGSLDDRHGYHPALVDEARYRYGRNYEENYNRSLVPEARRDLGGDPFLPAEHGAQLIVASEHLRGEVFLDWQLLETEEHREKFAFGLLGGFRHRWADVDLQLRLVHYGGELFTKGDPIRFAQLDPVRQPLAFAVSATLKPYAFEELFAVELPLAWVRGRLAQAPGAPPSARSGIELGAEVVLFEVGRVGYRAWLPSGGNAGFISEDGDPVYSGNRSHRVRFALTTAHGAASLSGRLDLLVADGAEKVQYEAVTALTFLYEPVLWSRGTLAPR